MKKNPLDDSYILYGSNRVAKDFLYIFRSLHIAARLSDDATAEEINAVRRENAGCRIILCDFDHSRKAAMLDGMGLKKDEDYVLEEDFFPLLDDINVGSKKDCLVWGAGSKGRLFLGECPDIRTGGFIDSNREIRHFEGYDVRHPEDVGNLPECYIIVAVVQNKEIIQFLEGKGLQYKKDYCIYDDVVGLPSRMLRRTIFDQGRFSIECHTMGNHLEIFRDGSAGCCCSTFVRQNLGNLLRENAADVWGSVRHRIMCLSLENRTYSFCDRTMCPLFVGCTAEKTGNTVTEYQYQEPYPHPKVLAVGIDSSCNLKCVTCRKTFHYAGEEENQVQRKLLDIIRDEYLKHAEFLILAGDGEVFASRTYRELYAMPECRPRYIRLLTNGTLFNEKNWLDLTAGKDCSVMMTVSIDAATRETYEKIRRGGKFDVLTKNMEYASGLKKRGELSYFRMNFVVQRENYKEIPEFIRWGESLGVNEVFFTKILNWGTYTDEEFEHISMMEKDGITPKKELEEILLSDEVRNSRIADLGTIQAGHKVDYTGPVFNYYMWELEKRGGGLFEEL